jgi:hypothetical protein
MWFMIIDKYKNVLKFKASIFNTPFLYIMVILLKYNLPICAHEGKLKH